MLLYIPIFDMEDDDTGAVIQNESEQEGFLKAFATLEEAEEYVLRKGYRRNNENMYEIDELYAYLKGESNEFSARIMSGGTPTHGKW